MAKQHQACVRAAAADYCGNGTSFTKVNTIVDIYDFGFVPRTDGGTYPSNQVTAMVWESAFDTQGAIQIDHSRFQETQAGSIEAACPGVFEPGGTDDVTCPLGSDSCVLRGAGWAAESETVVYVDSTPSCSHSEFVTGKWLHDNCDTCTALVTFALPYCSNPADSRGWDSACVAKANEICSTTQKMTTHGECTTGPALTAYDSGCTLAVCLNPATSYCCAAGGAWDAGCVAAADSSACSFAKKPCGTSQSCLATGLCTSQPFIVGNALTGGTFTSGTTTGTNAP